MEEVSLDDLDSFCGKYLVTWDKRSTLRHLDRYRIDRESNLHDIYPASCLDIAAHPALAESDNLLREVLIRAAFAVMEEVAGIEVLVVNDICNKLATRELSIPISNNIRQVALSVATDESYHALVAREFIQDLSELTGVVPRQGQETEGDEIALVKSIRQMLETLPKEMHILGEVIALCFAENFLTEGLFDLSKSSERDSAFQTIVREHLMDEGRHQAFFKKLLTYIWSEISEEERCEIAKVLPKFLDTFLANMERVDKKDRYLLEAVGFSDENIKKIVNDTRMKQMASWPGFKGGMEHTKPSIELLKLTGMLAHEPTKSALLASGWIKLQ